MRATHTAAAIALVLALGVSVTTCRLDKLINPATADRLVVNPDSVRVSADSGSLEPKDTTLHVTSADGAVLTWTATKTAAWVSLSPSPDSLVVTLDPNTLSQAVHRDTIVFWSPQSNDTVRVPVVFDIRPAAAHLDVSPTARNTSAFVGSAQPDTFSLRIKNSGALPLTWTAAPNATWITLSDSGGTVPPQDTTSTSVLVTLRPDTLSTATHTGRIVFSATAANGSPDTVPITYRIDPCVETLIATLDATRTASIVLSDCGAPRRAGRQAKLYRVQAAVGDTLTFRLTSAFNAYLILTDSAGTVVLDENDQCAAALTACLTPFNVSTAGRYVIEVTSTNPGETGAFTLSAVKERAPSPPQGIQQLRGDSATPIGSGLITPESLAVFKATVNDPNPGDSVRLEIELLETSGTFVGPSNYQGAFVGVNQTSWIRVPALRDDALYHWRAQTCDNTSRCSGWLDFGNPDPAVDFYVNSKPENPPVPTSIGQFTTGGAPIAQGGNSNGGNVVLSGTVSDPDPGDQVRLEVEVRTTGTNFTNVMTSASPFGPANRIAAVTVGATLLFGYHWQARTCDQTGQCSAWISFPQPTPNAESSADFVGSL